MKLLVADLDGSILNSNRISQRDIHEIKKWCEKGNGFTISTGRSLSRVKTFADDLQIDLPIILCNGAALYRRDYPLQIIKELDVDMIKTLLKDWQEKGFLKNCIIYFPDEIQLLCADFSLTDKIKKWEIDYTSIESIDKIKEAQILMLSFFRPGEELLSLIKKNPEFCEVGSGTDNYIDISPKGCSKGTTLYRLLQKHEFEEIFVIGDSENDLSMQFGNNIFAAVENAEVQVKKKADLIISSKDDNPISDLIEKIRRMEYGNI